MASNKKPDPYYEEEPEYGEVAQKGMPPPPPADFSGPVYRVPLTDEEKKKRTIKIILIVVGIVLGLGIIGVVGGVLALSFCNWCEASAEGCCGRACNWVCVDPCLRACGCENYCSSCRSESSSIRNLLRRNFSLIKWFLYYLVK